MSSSQSSRGPSSSKSDRGKKKQKQKQHKKKMSASHSSEPAEVILDICDSDVESDETLWDLYERWITHWKLSRSVDEKNERFPTFKKHAKHIHMENKMNRSACKLVLNPNSDMTMEEFENDFQNQRWRFEHIEIQDKDMESDDTLWDLYERWMIHYEQPRSLDEKNMRFGAFKEQVQYIHLHNKKDNMAYKLGLNQYSDMSKNEFESKFMGGSHPENVLKLYRMLREMGGICTKEIDGRRVNVGEVKMLKHNDEEALEAVVRMHPIIPITVWVDSRGNAFKNYRGGVLTEEVGKEPLQEVTLTGFRVTPDGVRYWEIKNTWSEKWGANGFMRIKRGVNLCGIAGYGCIALLD